MLARRPGPLSGRRGFSAIELSEIISRLPSILVGGLRLPGPDLEVGKYSIEVRAKRLQVALDAFIETYRECCEVAFQGLANNFLYGRGPIQGHAILRPAVNEANLSIQSWWEPVPQWGEPAIVEVGEFREYETLRQDLVTKHNVLGRGGWTSVSYGELISWWPQDSTVTKLVIRQLNLDLEDLIEDLRFPSN